MNLTKEQAIARIKEFEDNDTFVPINNIDKVKPVRNWSKDKDSENNKHAESKKDPVRA